METSDKVRIKTTQRLEDQRRLNTGDSTKRAIGENSSVKELKVESAM